MLTVVSAERPSLIADHALITGQVPLTTFEKVLSPSKMTVGVNGGFGCYPDKLPADERQSGRSRTSSAMKLQPSIT